MLSIFRRKPSLTPIQVGISGGNDYVPNGAPLTLVTSVPIDLIIDRLDKVPPHSSLLTTSDSRSVFRLPKELEYGIAAIEIGPKRAAILYDPSYPSKSVATEISNLRTRLISEDFMLERGEIACKSLVIRALVDDYKSRNSSDDDDGAASNSKSRSLWEKIVDLSVRERATDIHVQIVRNKAEVKIRVDGELEPLPDGSGGIYTASQAESAVAWGYTNGTQTDSNSASQFQAKLNLYAMIKPRVICGKQIALRYQSINGAYGPKVVCRILNTDMDAPTQTYEELGYAKSQAQTLKDASRTPSGLILFAGVTGSGKTTSLKTFIETHPGTGTSAFYSVEDPIEYPLRGVHQVPLQRDLLDKIGSNAKYAEVVAALMRADPDGVLVGEIRDQATAMAAQQIVETGHMAAGTVHAHLISGIISRLTDEEIGMSRKVLTNPNILTLAAYQALVPILCPECKIPANHASELPYVHHSSDGKHSADDGLNELKYTISQLESRFKLPREIFHYRRHGGCRTCGGRGTQGQTVVAEMLIPDRQWLLLTREEKDYEAIQHFRSFSDRRFDSDDMTGKTVFEHTLYKSIQGNVDPRQCGRFASLARFEILERK